MREIMEREIAVVVSNANENVNVIDTIDAIQNAGFQNVFIQWYNRDWSVTQEEQLRYVREKGLHVIFAHLGYQKIQELWLDTQEGDRLVERYQQDIRICKENGIPMVVMHLTSKTEYVIENIKNDNVGICFDSGHFHVYFKDDFAFARFKDRIFAVHLHDNDKNEDMHLLPFDGTIDWERIVRELQSCNYQGPITMEPCYRYGYLKMGLGDFYKKAYEKGEKLREMFA